MSTNTTSTNTTRDRTGARQSRSRRPLSLLALLAVVALNGCDLDVINPGPVQDGALDNPAAFDGLINGIKRTLTESFHHVGIKSAIRTRQLHAGLNDLWGRVNNDMHFGITHDEPFWDPWPRMQDARWLGEDALRRAEVIWPDAATMAITPAVAEANLWTGFTYRLFGDFYCEVAFDGGAAQDHDVAYQLAEQAFTDAINIATAAGHDEFLNAGLAGRASVRIHSGDWSGASQDAAQVPTDFSLEIAFTDLGGAQRQNYYAAVDFRHLHTTWHTFYDDYYTQTSDPRTPWKVDPLKPDVITLLDPWSGTAVPLQQQQKYLTITDPMEVASGAEMRLIEAEWALRNNDMSTAMTLINDLRTGVGVAVWPTPANINEAWGYLKAERGIELWLEGRRFADRRRWDEEGTPGALDQWELGGTVGATAPWSEEPDLSSMDLCYPIPKDEVRLNDNL